LGERIKLTASDGFELNAYEAIPEGVAPKAAVVVIGEVWGLNRFVRGIVDRLALHGYLAVSPATFDRVELGYESEDYGPSGFAKIGELFKSFDRSLVPLDVAAAIQRVAHAGKVGITGFCFGGATAWRSAHAGMGLSAASGYYGGGLPDYIDLAPAIPTEMHYGGHDHGIPLEQVEALRARYPGVPVYLYPADHGFMNHDRTANFEPVSAEKAWNRTLDFFAKHLS
jgi:carboxymethylenebutenolidase